MTFDYFLFDTYAGFFAEVLPFAMIAGLLVYFIRYHKDKTTPKMKKAASCLLVSYLVGLMLLVAMLYPVKALWHLILYGNDGGIEITWFQGSVHLLPDFFTHINKEVIGNVLAFVPFGVLFPLAHDKATIAKTTLAGFAVSLIIELTEPIFSRCLEVNDLIMNTLGAFLGAVIIFAVRRAVKVKHKDQA